MAFETNSTPPSNSSRLLLEEFTPPTLEEWQAEAERSLKGRPLEKLITKTYEGIDVQPMYRRADAADLPYLNSLPGFAPYLRGSAAAGYTTAPWLISQEIPYSTAADFNSALRYDMERGQTAVHLPLDQASQLGHDPDEALPGSVGADGVSIATVDDLAAALEGIDLEQTPLFFGATSAAVPTAALLFALVKRQGRDTANLRGSLEMDPLGTLARTGQLPRSVAGAYNVMAHLLRWSLLNAPHFLVVTVHGQPYADAGASAVQELAFVLATATEYLRQMIERGLSVNDVAPRLRFSLSVGGNYFMEVAKLRAARLVWAKVVKAFGGSDDAQKLTLHARTAAGNKTVYDPWVNMLRVTTEAFAGAVAGVDSLHTGHFDEAIGQPDEFSRRIARNTQIILQNEAHLSKVVDPAGGAYTVEKLTDDVARRAWTLFQQVEQQGGMAAALSAGFPQGQVAQVAAARTKNLATRKDVLVGTNRYPNLIETVPPARHPDHAALHQTRSQAIAEYRTGLSNEQNTAVLAALARVLDAKDEAVLAAAIDAALAGATLGELARTLRHGDETVTSVTPLALYRAAAPFEALRDFAEDYATEHGHRPRVFLANLGPIPQHKARADFATDFFQVGGFEVLNNNGFAAPDAAAQAALDSGAPIVVICSTDDDYPQAVPPICRQVKAANPDVTVVLAGYPADQIEAHKAAGVNEFIHVRADVVDVLGRLQGKLVTED
ncbi:MAG: Methylmalonyl-CoA mutase [Anaerolineae bacterium]|nr:Methylmalonyl-CoA mutase [Anaerolineae bacterium]